MSTSDVVQAEPLVRQTLLHKKPTTLESNGGEETCEEHRIVLKDGKFYGS